MQVLINLLSNGVKYNREGGQLTLSCAPEQDFVRIAVSDTGIGISTEDLEKLFTPFERLNAVNTGIEGTGLGLALSKSLIESMNGTLTVESKIGEGSTFWVRLPLAKEHLQTTSANPISEASASYAALSGNFTLLSIEDNISNYRLMEMIFKKRPGVRLLGAMQGTIGLELAHQHRPDLILLDMHLPDLSGAEILHKLKADATTAKIPVVICSADATEAQVHSMLAAGANAYLTKPLNVSELLRILDQILVKSGEPAPS